MDVVFFNRIQILGFHEGFGCKMSESVHTEYQEDTLLHNRLLSLVKYACSCFYIESFVLQHRSIKLCDENAFSFRAHKVMHDESYEGYECEICRKILHTKGR